MIVARAESDLAVLLVASRYDMQSEPRFYG